jgi:TolB-like protein/predicted Ser/Thr protein kinase
MLAPVGEPDVGGGDSTILLGEAQAVAPSDVRGPVELAAGSLFAGRYAVECLLGRGGMGVVYRARDRLLDEQVALKLLDVAAQLGEEALEMFKREVRIARRVTHPSVVRIHGLDEHRGQHFITMQYIEGSDLRRELDDKGGRLSAPRAARVALEVAQGLEAAHAMGVVHRDLKPENVLVDRAGRAILSDFGIARIFDHPGEARTTRVVGTPAYMAPEQVVGGDIGPLADVYALGVVLFEMLAGRTPFIGDNPIAVAVARVGEPAPDIRALGAAGSEPIPEVLAALTMDCLERTPERRPAGTSVVVAELSAYLDEVALAEVPLVRSASVTQRPRSLRGGRPSRALALPFGSGRASLACLPFAYRGPADHDYLGEAVSGELTDVLSRTKGLRVLSSGAVAKTQERDPRKLTADLDVDYVVDGTVQFSGAKLRITVRLVDASASQLFSERFDLGLKDLFDMQDEAGRRIAEALRLELSTRSVDVEVPEEAMRAFLQARRILRAQLVLEAPHAVALLERVLELAPGFTPAIATLAIATVSVWFYPQGDRSRDWGEASRAAVARALAEAPELVETHVAAARVASHEGRLRDAILSLRRAVDIAPTSVDAHTLLGQLECETGRSDEGLARLALAHQLEPSGVYPYEAARLAALRGDHADFDKQMAIVRKHQAPLIALHLELRHAAWWADRQRLEAITAEAPSLGPPFDGVFDVVAKTFLGDLDPQRAVAALAGLMPHVNARFSALFRQILVEVHAAAGDLEGALDWLREAQGMLLYDVPWLESCHLFIDLRKTEAFRAVFADVRARCDAVWGA